MPRRYEFEEALLEHVEAEQRPTPKGSSSPNKKIASTNRPTQTAAMALLARILKARVSPAPGRGGLLGARVPRLSRPEGARLPAGARAEDKEAGRLGAPRAGGRAEGPRSLAAMPGPRTLANLVEFFWKDGFSRIHEIQVAGRTGPGGERARGLFLRARSARARRRASGRRRRGGCLPEGTPGGGTGRGTPGKGRQALREGDVKEGCLGGTPRRRHRAADAGEGTPGRGRQERGFKEGRQSGVTRLGAPARGLWGVSPKRGAGERIPGRRPRAGWTPAGGGAVWDLRSPAEGVADPPRYGPEGGPEEFLFQRGCRVPARERCEQL